MSGSTRENLAERIASIGGEVAQALAEFATCKGASGELPCWGAIAEFLDNNLTDDTVLDSLWRTVVDAGDPRAQLVLLSVFKDNPALVERAARDAAAVSPAVRQALNALNNPNDTESNRGFETRVNELLAVRYFVPDSVEPQLESQRRSK